MIWILIPSIILVAGGMYAAGVASADGARALWWLLADRLRSLRGPAPVYVPEHPRFGALLDTPPGGITVVRDDGAISVRADLPVTRKPTVDHAPTGPFAAVPYTPEPASWAEQPPTMEELRRQYDSWKQPVYNSAPQLAVAEAQRLAEVMQP